MKKTFLVILALVMTLTMVIGFAIPASATPAEQNGNSLSIVQPGGGAYIHVTKLVPGDLEFNYGWDNSNHFASPVGSYWIGVYDVTASHYDWVTGWVNYSESKLKLSQTVDNLTSGDFYKFVFFVRDQPNGLGNSLVDFEYPPFVPSSTTVVFYAP